MGLQLIRMSAGIPDFEPIKDGAKSWVDSKLLSHGFHDFSPHWLLRKAAGILGPNQTMLCDPGTCSAYSSTSINLAGMVLASVLGSAGEIGMILILDVQDYQEK